MIIARTIVISVGISDFAILINDALYRNIVLVGCVYCLEHYLRLLDLFHDKLKNKVKKESPSTKNRCQKSCQMKIMHSKRQMNSEKNNDTE